MHPNMEPVRRELSDQPLHRENIREGQTRMPWGFRLRVRLDKAPQRMLDMLQNLPTDDDVEIVLSEGTRLNVPEDPLVDNGIPLELLLGYVDPHNARFLAKLDVAQRSAASLQHGGPGDLASVPPRLNRPVGDGPAHLSSQGLSLAGKRSKKHWLRRTGERAKDDGSILDPSPT